MPPSPRRRPAVDPALLARAAAGEPASRATLVERCGPRLWALCKRLAEAPEDAWQEIWEKAFHALSRFDPLGSASLETWLATLAHHHLVDLHRRQVVRRRVLSIEGADLEGQASERPDPERQLQDRQQGARLERALARLPEQQRRVVVMHHMAGHPLAEIAEVEGISVGTVKSRLHRARARLAAVLEEP